MRAITYRRYGPPDVLTLEGVDTPAPQDDEVLIRVRAASINRSDWETLTGSPAYVRISGAGFLRPKRPILGTDVAGTIEAVGANVTRFEPGDEVLGDIMYFGVGAFAEYVSVPERAPLVPKPAGLSFEEAAALPQAAVLALQGLRNKGQVEPGQRVLIVGGGGGSGTFAVQLAKMFGAEVTGIDNGLKLELMRSLGAGHVIDYTADDYSKSGQTYDRILDFVAGRSVFANRRVLDPDGIYLLVGGPVRRMLAAAALGPAVSLRSGRRMGMLLARPNSDDLSHVVDLVMSETLTPVIDGPYGLSEVPEALRRVGEGRALGKAVITV